MSRFAAPLDGPEQSGQRRRRGASALIKDEITDGRSIMLLK